MIFLRIAAFLLGMYMAIRMIAALFRIVDLWYAANDNYPRMIRGVLGWGTATVALTVVMSEVLRIPFLWGLAVFSCVYLMGLPLNWLLGRRSLRSRV